MSIMTYTMGALFTCTLLLGCVLAINNPTQTNDVRPKWSQMAGVNVFEVTSVDSPHFVATQQPVGVTHEPTARSYEYIGWEHELASHPLQSSFNFASKGVTYGVTLEKNTNLFGANYFEEVQEWSNGKLIGTSRQSLREENNCHYHGTIEGYPGGYVAASTCDGGFSAYIQLSADNVLIMEPAHSSLSTQELSSHLSVLSATRHPRSLHVVYHTSDRTLPGGECAVGKASTFGAASADGADSHSSHSHASRMPLSARHLADHGDHSHVHGDDAHDHAHDNLEELTRARLSHIKGGPARRLLDTTTQRYVEELYVNDKVRYDAYDGKPEVNAALLANQVDAFYKATAFAPPIRMVLVAQVSFSVSDPYTVTIGTAACSACGAGQVSVDELLSKYNAWRANYAPAHDNGHLLSGYEFEGAALGYAGVGTMCLNSQTGGIDMTLTKGAWPTAGPATNDLSAATLAHEMGHNFGMQHDSTGNACPQSGYIMNAVVDSSNPPVQFSSCSMTYLNTLMKDISPDCTLNVPTFQWGDPNCGNGYVEGNETCDCGSRDCRTIDPCCNGTTCRFVPGAECSSLGTCCNAATCSFVAANTKTCRASSGACDIAETCNGTYGFCPDDDFVGSGTACSSGYGDGVCYAGDCLSHERECREVGSKFSGAPYDSCPVASQMSLNSNNYCGTMWCTNTPGQCTLFRVSSVPVTMYDGISCDTGKQCLSGSCQSSAVLNTRYVWFPTVWSECTSCDQNQYRSINCTRISDGQIVIDAYCPPVVKPSTQQQCQNPALGCAYSTADSDEVELFGYNVAKNTLMFGTMGACALFLVILAICYQAVTWGSEDLDNNDDAAASKKSAPLPVPANAP